MPPSSSAGGPPRPQYLLLGKILRPHGVTGELRVHLLTAYPERLPDMETVYIGRDPESPDVTPHLIESVRFHQGNALIRLAGVTDRDQADRFRQLYLMVAIADAVPLEDGEVYLFQLIGMAVQTQDGETLGTITDVLETGANDVYIVDSPRYGEVLIPATDHTIIKTDAANRLVIVDLPEGLLPGS
ncbi:MAG: 16S rRNA processing protein RimM [Chloroflexi bacterium]|nr:16S rRNA processing protein RimM [Chloroflexota bacterium]